MKHVLFVAVSVALVVPALAHDMWLVPPARPDAGAIEVEVAVGMDFPLSVSAIDPARVTARAVGPRGATADVLVRRDEDRERTAVSFEPSAPGAWVVTAVTKPNVLALDADDFNDYLLHDGLAHVLAERLERGEADRPAVERYSKHVKALVVAPGEASDGTPSDVHATPLGLELEILVLADPLAARPGDTLPARVLFRGRPLAHANLCWDLPGNGADFSGQTWTDADGFAWVPLAPGSSAGPMTLRLVHMTRPQDPEHEWESFWASFTFRVGGGG